MKSRAGEKKYTQGRGCAIHTSDKAFLSSMTNAYKRTIWKELRGRWQWKGVNGNNVFILNKINPQLAYSIGP